MVLEACIICCDNSDWTRNGDYTPTRWEAQVEAANIITENKCDKNPENALGIVTMAGKRVETPVTLTNDVSKLLKSLKEVSLHGNCDFVTSCNIAMLILKHRQNKNQKQRILMFVASPIKNTNDELTLLGKKLKKNNIAIDVISYGNTDQNKEAVNLLVNTANNSNNSHLMEVTPDQFIVDCLFTSPILNDNLFEDNQMGGVPEVSQPATNNQPSNNQPSVPSGGLSQFERDINLAIQQSMEEEERRRKANEGENTEEVAQNNNSINNVQPTNQAGSASSNVNPEKKNEMIVDDEIEDEDLAAELEKARLLSIKEHEETVKKEKEKEQSLKKDLIQNDEFMKELLGEVGMQNEFKDIMDEVKEKTDEGEEKDGLINKNKDSKDEKDTPNEEEDGSLIPKNKTGKK
eukprot:CAMPEP_0170519152 /NCGR_PEP_ID=MMETSP0209-20121228/4669_1 /TAXON_ID=665100 ORGANISM="Litonotus pictus, Strain P1" /NCGR_SAMPLE_ID=MMETSP0209 /ASSEMBLY_ACC=CAM_ASM_000301 /LENGTH=404 /DNA_ID=CAMNT_0010804969 /DNA_START=1 /DNA_END=1215 /DNA_ORIENTATION=+